MCGVQREVRGVHTEYKWEYIEYEFANKRSRFANKRSTSHGRPCMYAATTRINPVKYGSFYGTIVKSTVQLECCATRTRSEPSATGAAAEHLTSDADASVEMFLSELAEESWSCEDWLLLQARRTSIVPSCSPQLLLPLHELTAALLHARGLRPVISRPPTLTCAPARLWQAPPALLPHGSSAIMVPASPWTSSTWCDDEGGGCTLQLARRSPRATSRRGQCM